MATIQDTVRPGDVISSDLLNRIIALLNEHDVKLSTGSGGGSTPTQIITGFSPSLEQNVNRNLTIFGNFDFPLATNALSIDGVPISPAAFLPGSNNLQLVFKIPATFTVPAGGSRTVTVRIVNTKGTDQRSYRLLPEVAGPPDPAITGVLDSAANNTPVRSGMEAKIQGQNFATPATTNSVQLVLNPGPAQHLFPLVVKSGTIVPAPGTSTLLVDMPVLTNSDGVGIGDTAPATISVTAPGANAPGIFSLSIRRIA